MFPLSKSIYKSIIFCIIFTLFLKGLKAQNNDKQHNTTGSELYADAPYRIIKAQNNGVLNSVPIHFYIHHSNDNIYNNELAYIDIKLKNAEDTLFTQLLTFNNLNNSQFKNLFIHPSIGDSSFGIQDFWESLPQKSNQHTIIFTKDINIWLPPVPYVNINKPYFYFTFLIPGNSLSAFGDVIDFEVCFGLDWYADEYIYLRVDRNMFSFPKVTDWYRGDVHYHGMFTQNDAENGLPLEATKLAAQLSGLDWITITDHSCDFDNYGTGMNANWQRLGNTINTLNNQDSSFVFIRGMEFSINNSDNKTVHALIYPDENSPYSLPYIGDGGGDLTATSINIDKMCDSLEKYNAFTYAAHPFAEKDALPFPINGGIWNLNDSLLPENGFPHPSVGSIISNNLSLSSDIYADNGDTLIKKQILGAQVWNYWKTLNSSQNPYNPWNVNYNNSVEFSHIPYSEPSHHLFRLKQNLDVYTRILQRGLIEKNANSNLSNWKFFLSGGSDAHGDFNYSNTSFITFAGLSYDDVTDNAIGKINTLVYCPEGMDKDGKNILRSLRHGHSIISSGPVMIVNLHQDGVNPAIPGDDIIITDINNSTINFKIYTNPEFGDVSYLNLYLGTAIGEKLIALTYSQTGTSVSLSDVINTAFTSIPENTWLYIRAEIETKRVFNTEEAKIFKKHSELFHCLSNPIWFKINTSQDAHNQNMNVNKLILYPNPARDLLYVNLQNAEYTSNIEIYTSRGIEIRSPFKIIQNTLMIDISALSTGLYTIRLTTKQGVYSSKFIIQ